MFYLVSARKWFWALVATSVIAILFLLSYNLDRFQQYLFILPPDSYLTDQKEGNLSLDRTQPTCIIPKLDPWDPSIQKWIYHMPGGLRCSKVQPFMTFLDYHGFLRLNKSEILNLGERKFTCYYKTFDRKPGEDDNAIEYDKLIPLIDDVKLTKDNVDVKCKYKDNDEVFYWNIHAHPAETLDRIFGQPTEDQLNVLVFLIDSVSFSAMQRSLPRTYNYTKNIMRVKFFKALNKVGDNSLPNQMAMFIGKRTSDEQKDMMREVYTNSSTYFDAWPFIWKMFAAKGYATVFNEDMPKWGLFHHAMKGFMKKPTDFYYHVFWQEVTNGYISGQDHFCFGNSNRATITIDLVKRHLISLRNKLYFVYSTLSELPHDADNRIEMADNDLVEFWKNMYEGNLLNKTFVMFASDHGIRHGNIRTSLVGMLEERLPFYGLWFPSWFYKKHPNIAKNIDGNLDTLSSSFDGYETFLDVLNGNFDGTQRDYKSRSQSQLYPLPKNRTCKSAGIPDHFCTCVKSNSLKVHDPSVVTAAQSLVDHLNKLFEKKNVTHLCRVIKLSKVLYVNKLDFDEKLKSGQVYSYNSAIEFDAKKPTQTVQRNRVEIGDKLEMGVETEPNKATFESLLKLTKRSEVTEQWIVDGSISRTSRYAGLSECVEKDLRKYCSCVA